jgi:hypothetical protein
MADELTLALDAGLQDDITRELQKDAWIGCAKQTEGSTAATSISAKCKGINQETQPFISEMDAAAVLPTTGSTPPSLGAPPATPVPPLAPSQQTTSTAETAPSVVPSRPEVIPIGQGLEDWIRKRLYKVGAQVEATPGLLATVLPNLSDEQLAPPFTDVKLWLGLDDTQGMSPPLEQIVTEYRKLAHGQPKC